MEDRDSGEWEEDGSGVPEREWNSRRGLRRKGHANGGKTSDYIGSVVVNGILLYVVNKIPSWNLSFITEAFSQVLFAMNLSLGAQVGGNLFVSFYREKRARNGILFLLDIASLYGAVTVLRVFPFRFDEIPVPFLEKGVRIVLMVGIAVTAISAVVRFVKFVVSLVRGRDPAAELEEDEDGERGE